MEVSYISNLFNGAEPTSPHNLLKNKVVSTFLSASMGGSFTKLYQDKSHNHLSGRLGKIKLTEFTNLHNVIVIETNEDTFNLSIFRKIEAYF